MAKISKKNSLPAGNTASPGDCIVLPDGREFILNNAFQWIQKKSGIYFAEKGELTSENLNIILNQGIYHQLQNGQATNANNYPISCAGILEVFYSGPGQIFQRYTVLAGQTEENSIYQRGCYNDVWSLWKKINIDQSVSDNKYLAKNFLQERAIGDSDIIMDGVQAHYSPNANPHKPTGQDHSLFTLSFNSVWSTQLAGDWRTNDLYLRSQNQGNWTNWGRLLHTLNYQSILDLKYLSLGGGTLDNGGRIDSQANIIIQQLINGGNATGMFWEKMDNSAKISGIGTTTNNGELDYSFIGWGASPWNSPNALIIKENLFTYKDYTIWHSGNLTTTRMAIWDNKFKDLKQVGNLNDVVESGIYRQEQPANAYNYSTTLNLNSGDGRQQLIIERGGSGMKFRGNATTNGTTEWSLWKRVWSDADFTQAQLGAWQQIANYPVIGNYTNNPVFINRMIVGEIAWRNYGNNHSITDLSGGSLPNGLAKSNKDAEIPWTAGYPMLVGSNNQQTFGVRVDSARTADGLADTSYINKKKEYYGNGNGFDLNTAKNEHGFVYSNGSIFDLNGPFISFGRLGSSDEYQGQLMIDYQQGKLLKYRSKNGDANEWNLPKTVVNQEDNQDISGIKNFTNNAGVWSTRYKFGTGSNSAAGKVTNESSFYTLGVWNSNGAPTEFGYGVSTNTNGGLDIMANQAGQYIRFWGGNNNDNPFNIADFRQTEIRSFVNITIEDGKEIRLKGSGDFAHVIKHFSDDTDGFNVSTGFAVKNYANNQNLFNVDNGGSSYVAAHLRINNLGAATGVGLHLFPSSMPNGSPRFGIHFSQTSIFGKFGDVTGDWSTYFTTGGDVLRGWMWRDESFGNIASLSGRGMMTVGGSYTVNGFNTDYLLTSGGTKKITDFDSSFYTTFRNFTQGTLIKTSINTAQYSFPFILKIEGNTYGGGTPIHLMLQGYIWDGAPGTIVNATAFSTVKIVGDIKIFSIGGNMCFWFAPQSYWQGYNIKITQAMKNSSTDIPTVNFVTSVTDEVMPSTGLLSTVVTKKLLTEDDGATKEWTEGRYIQKWENAIAIGFSSGNVNASPYIYHNNGTYIHLATQVWVDSNFGYRNGSNATDAWRNAAHGLVNNPSIPGRIVNGSGNSDLINATYGDVMGMINTSGKNNGNPTDDWYHRIKLLHNNSAGYFTELALQMTSGGSLWFRRLEAGNPMPWVQVWDKTNLTDTMISRWNYATDNTFTGYEKVTNQYADRHIFYRNNGTTFEKYTFGLGVMDTRNTGNGLNSPGNDDTYVPNSNVAALDHKFLPIFHVFSKYGSWASSLITKGWNNSYRAWRITGPASSDDNDRDFYLNQTKASDGTWMTDRMIWTDKHFSLGDITNWNNMSSGNYINKTDNYEITGKKAFLTTGPVFTSASLEVRSNNASWKPALSFNWTPSNYAAQIKFDGSGFEFVDRNGEFGVPARAATFIAGNCLIGTQMVGDETGLIGMNDDYIAIADYPGNRYMFGAYDGISVKINGGSNEVGIGPGGYEDGIQLKVNGDTRVFGIMAARNGFIHEQYNDPTKLLTSDGGVIDVGSIGNAPYIVQVPSSGQMPVNTTNNNVIVFGNPSGGNTVNVQLPNPNVHPNQKIEICKTGSSGVLAIYKNGVLMFNMMSSVKWTLISTGVNYIFINENNQCQLL